MSLEINNIGKFNKRAYIAPVNIQPTEFRRKMNILNKVYVRSDRNTKLLLKKMLLVRIKNAEKKLASGKIEHMERELIMSNLDGYKAVWNQWKLDTSTY